MASQSFMVQSPSYTEATGRTTSIQTWGTQYPVTAPRTRYDANTPNSYQSFTPGLPDSHWFQAEPVASASATSDDELLREALQFTNISPSPPRTHHTRLASPTVIPQAVPGLGKPFVRAYSAALSSRGISMLAFLQFIDNFNVVSAASPPLQVLGLAGQVLGVVPSAISQIVGGALSLTAQLGTVAVSQGRATLFLNEADETFFQPRGLQAAIATSKALKAKVRIDPNAPLVSALEEAGGMDVQARRMRALEGRIAPLTFDVPPPTQQTNAPERLSARQASSQLARADEKALEGREKLVSKGEGGKIETKAQRDLERELEKIERDRRKLQSDYEKDIAKVEKDRAKTTKGRESPVCIERQRK